MKKTIFTLIFLIIFLNLSAQKLNILVDENRFLDDFGNTILEINYQCSYKNLLFFQTEKGFSAKLGVKFSLMKNDEVVYSDEFTNRVILSEEIAIHSNRYFSDKISLTLSKSGFKIEVNFIDINSGNEKEWNSNFEILESENIFSDIEFLSGFEKPDSTNVSKFQKNEKIHFINPSHIYTAGIDDFFIYYEMNLTEKLIFSKKIIITKNDKEIFNKNSEIKGKKSKQQIYEKIDIDKFKEGYYEITIILFERKSGKYYTISDFFSIKEQRMKNIQIFPDIEKEFLLIKYFINTNRVKIWKTLTKVGKQNFIKRFWDTNNADNHNFHNLIRERVQFANKNYSAFKNGWQTDRGRIYIKYGAPDEIVKKETGLYTKYTQKKYQIWKYRTHNYYTFIFFDLYANGSFDLIYSDYDEDEISISDWKNYLGKDFDSSWLQ